MFVEILRKVIILNYERFSNIDAAYTDFLNKLMKIFNNIVPSKEIRIKSNNENWFNGEVADLIHVWEKLLLKFKKNPNFISMKKVTKK